MMVVIEIRYTIMASLKEEWEDWFASSGVANNEEREDGSSNVISLPSFKEEWEDWFAASHKEQNR